MATTKYLSDVFLDELRDLYDAEKQLVRALPKLARAAGSDDLRTAIESHLEETKGHVDRLEQVFGALGEKPRGKRCAGIAGIIEESDMLLDERVDQAVLDAAIIAGAQRAEHYEIGAYGSLIAWAKAMGRDEAVAPLEETLEEEKSADEKLTEIAEGGLNEQAAARGSSEDADTEEPPAGRTGRPHRGNGGRARSARA